MRGEVEERARRIRLLLLDVDGVLTDGSFLMGPEGEEMKAFHVRDGHGIKLLRGEGIEVGIISGRRSRALEHRARDLGVSLVIQGVYDKVESGQEIMKRLGVKEEETCFVGDDIGDIPLLKKVGLPVAVGDAQEEVKESALYVTRSSGGRGAVREVCELILRCQGRWEEIMMRYKGR